MGAHTKTTVTLWTARLPVAYAMNSAYCRKLAGLLGKLAPRLASHRRRRDWSDPTCGPIRGRRRRNRPFRLSHGVSLPKSEDKANINRQVAYRALFARETGVVTTSNRYSVNGIPVD